MDLDNKIRLILAACSFCFILGMFMYAFVWTPPSSFPEQMQYWTGKGIVTEIIEDKRDRHLLKGVLRDGTKVTLYGDMKDRVDVGDSIVKKKGDEFLFVYKPNGELIKIEYSEVFPD